MPPSDPLNGPDAAAGGGLVRDGERLMRGPDGDWVVVGRDGKRRRIVPDGGMIRTSLLAMDSMKSATGDKRVAQVTVDGVTIETDEKTAGIIRSLMGQRDALALVAQQRGGQQPQQATDAAGALQQARAAEREAYQRSVQRTLDAWKGPHHRGEAA